MNDGELPDVSEDMPESRVLHPPPQVGESLAEYCRKIGVRYVSASDKWDLAICRDGAYSNGYFSFNDRGERVHHGST